jgi:hypothetical protein
MESSLGNSESCFDYLVDNVLVLLSTIQIVADILFAAELRNYHMSCAESCKSGETTETCSNGRKCPEFPNMFNNLFIGSVIFIVLPSLIQLSIASLPLYGSEEKYNKETKESFRKYVKLSESKTKLSVLVNGDRIETFYLYQTRLPWSRVAIQQLYKRFDSRIQVLKRWTVLLPLYGLCHVVHFLAFANSIAWIAKIALPKNKLPDQEAIAPEFQVVDSPDSDFPKVTRLPAVLITRDWKLSKIDLHFNPGILFKSFPQFMILCIYLFLYLGYDDGGGPYFSMLVSGFSSALVLSRMIVYQISAERAGELRRAEAFLRQHFALRLGHGDPEGTIEVIKESIDA